MNKRMKYAVYPLIIMFILILVMAGCTCQQPDGTESINLIKQQARLPITYEQYAALKEGMSISEVVTCLGYAGTDIASGTIIYAYIMEDGQMLRINFENMSDGEFRVTSFAIYSVSPIDEMKQ